MPPPYFPLRWESTGDQWWYASPIDWAAANGLYDVVAELLHLDTNLLIKLTSLRRIRRLETVWDDNGSQFADVAVCRSYVARKLLVDCESKIASSNRNHHNNSLIRAGYGGWLLYTAAAAGDVEFVKHLLERDPLLVFGEGEYGVTDMLYAAASSQNRKVFDILLDFAFLPSGCGVNDVDEVLNESQLAFKKEMVKRGVHSAARGGNIGILKELIGEDDVFAYTDMQGNTVLHTASARGQLQVVKDLVSCYDIITSVDNQGNTALHVAAYRGHLAVVEFLIQQSPGLTSITNSNGDTFLHMAVSGFKTPGFRRIDRQINLIKNLLTELKTKEIVNLKNNRGRTALHIAVTGNVHYSLVELLMTVKSIDLNICDDDGFTPLDVLKQRPKSTSSEMLIKQLVSAGGMFSYTNNNKSTVLTQLKELGFSGSPGTSFRVSDSEIFLYTGVENRADTYSFDQESDDNYSEMSDYSSCSLGNTKKASSINSAAKRLMFILKWTKKREKGAGLEEPELRSFETRKISLRKIYSESDSNSNKRNFSLSSDFPSRSSRMKFAEGLMHGVIRTSSQSVTSSPISRSELQKARENNNNMSQRRLGQKQTSMNKRLVNKYFCLGSPGIAVEESTSCVRPDRSYNRVNSMVA